MDAASLLAELRGQGIELWFEGDRLRFRAPRGALGPQLRASLSAQRSQVLAHLRAEAAKQATVHPLSYSQQSLWFIHQQAPESAAYHVGVSARIRSPIEVPALRQALQALVDRHAALRTTYAIVDGVPSQRVAGWAPVAFQALDAAGLTDEALRASVLAAHHRPFDLEQGPLLRASLHTRQRDDHVLLVTVHHIAADGWSLMVLMDELLRLHAEAVGGAPAALPRPTVSCVDHAAWQAQVLAGPEGERWWAYWREQLAAPRGRLEWPSDRPRPPTPSFRGSAVPVDFGPEVAEGVRQLARQEGTTPFVVLQAAFHAFLHRVTGSEDVIVGTPTFARSKPEYLRVVGDFVNPVALRSRPTGATRFRALVGALRRTVVGALDAQEFPFPLLVRRLQPDRDASRSPLFDAFLVVQRFEQYRELEGLLGGDASTPPLTVHGLSLAPYPIVQQEGQFDLVLQVVEREGSLFGALKYATDLFDEGTVRGFAGGLAGLLAAALRDPDLTLAQLPVPGAAARAVAPPAAAGPDRALAYWRQELAGAPAVLELPLESAPPRDGVAPGAAAPAAPRRGPRGGAGPPGRGGGRAAGDAAPGGVPGAAAPPLRPGGRAGGGAGAGAGARGRPGAGRPPAGGRGGPAGAAGRRPGLRRGRGAAGGGPRPRAGAPGAARSAGGAPGGGARRRPRPAGAGPLRAPGSR
ncbi:MAG: condensation domain-containing protein [Anaeromyxobacter sp.]